MAKDTISKFVSYLRSNPSQLVGLRLAEYVDESDNQGWEGFSEREVTTIRKFLADFQLFVSTYEEPS